MAEFSGRFEMQMEQVTKGSRVTRKLGAFARKKSERSNSQASKKTDTVIEKLQGRKNGHQFGLDLPETNANPKPVIDTGMMAPTMEVPMSRPPPPVFVSQPQPFVPLPPPIVGPTSLPHRMSGFPRNAPVQKLNFDVPV